VEIKYNILFQCLFGPIYLLCKSYGMQLEKFPVPVDDF
jgi:hypothetical protein